MAFASAAAKIWPVPPDWTNGVVESLAWATDVSQSSATAATHRRSWRLGPRRRLTFDVTGEEQEHRAIDMLLAGHRGSWLLPIWPDVQWLDAPLAANVEEVPCRTAGFDFVAGGQALLYTAVNTWEVVGIDSVEADHIALSAPTLGVYAVGSRLYPLRRAIAQDGADATLRNAAVSRRRLSFDIIEACDWPALVGGSEYLGHRVLDVWPAETEDLTYSFAGLRSTVDYGAAPPATSDLPGIALRAQRDGWALEGREEHTWFRSLLYTLRGRQRPLWVPSWSADLKPVASIAGSSTSLSIEWAGYTLFGLGKPNRRDVRIELNDGTVYYRRITNAVEAGETETLTLSASLSSSSIAPGQVRQVSFLALCTLASDSTEISHETDADGLATATTGWQAVVPDV
jgi:hypothetical protein